MSGPVPHLYELRRGNKIIATGHVDHERPLQIGERTAIGGHAGIVREILPILGQNKRRLILELLPTTNHP